METPRTISVLKANLDVTGAGSPFFAARAASAGASCPALGTSGDGFAPSGAGGSPSEPGERSALGGGVPGPPSFEPSSLRAADPSGSGGEGP